MEKPIFITGLYRSGTTILSQIVGAHSEINMTYDSVNYFRFIIKKNIKPEEYKGIVESIASRLKKRHAYKIDTYAIINNIELATEPITHKLIYSCFMKGFFKTNNKSWGEKSLLEWTNVPLFLSMFEHGKCLHIIRDPRDVLVSYKNMTIEEGDKYLDAIFASLSSLNYALKYKNTIPTDRYKLVIYEDLMEKREIVTREICDFLSIKYEINMLNEDKYLGLDGSKFTYKTNSSFPNDKSIPTNRWRKLLNSFEIDFTEAVVGKQMKILGYELSDENRVSGIKNLLISIKETPLLASRLERYLSTGKGVEEYPSDPTDPNNWGSDSGIKDEGASAAYGKLS